MILIVIMVTCCTRANSHQKGGFCNNANQNKKEVDTCANNNEDDSFAAFLDDFFNDCFWDIEFNKSIVEKRGKIKKYIDPKMDIRRYYSPGASAYLYTRDQNFGFDEYEFGMSDWVISKRPYCIVRLTDYMSICYEDFGTPDGQMIIYLNETNSNNLTEVVKIDQETTITKKVETPYSNAKIMEVYLPNYCNPRVLLFIETPNGWKLGFIDDDVCGA